MNIYGRCLLLGIISGATFSAPAQTVEGPPVAVVNAKPIPAFHLEEWMKSSLSEIQKDTPELRARTLEDLIKREVLAQEAERLGIADRPYVKSQLAFSRQYMLGSILGTDFTDRNPVSDEEVLSEYKKYREEASVEREYHLWHLTVKKEDDTKTIAAKLESGADFEKLVEEMVTAESSVKGGGVGWIPSGQLPPALARALTELKTGQSTRSPIPSPEGFVFLKVKNVRPAKVALLAEIRPRLVERLDEKKRELYFASLRSKANVQYWNLELGTRKSHVLENGLLETVK